MASDTLNPVVSHVWLGNPQAVEVVPERLPDGRPKLDDNGRELKVRVPVPDAGWTVVDRIPGHPVRMLVKDIMDPGGLWGYHSDAPGPTWVASDDPALAVALSMSLECPVADIPADA